MFEVTVSCPLLFSLEDDFVQTYSIKVGGLKCGGIKMFAYLGTEILDRQKTEQ